MSVAPYAAAAKALLTGARVVVHTDDAATSMHA
jgi:hypothetical protein